ncbi:MAG: restriction endonuclease subunit R, partial [Candidatus Marsarchaeota archaeon]|nr:restriction endonuclease subunit R [Candidatus Marsarchaeota archaeon]
AVTSDAAVKDHFLIVDAVGVVDLAKYDTQTLERKRKMSFEKLVEQVSLGKHDEDTLSSIAARLSKLERTADDDEQKALTEVAGGASLRDISNALLDAIDPDKITELAKERFKVDEPSREQMKQAQEWLAERATSVFDSPEFRKLLLVIQRRSEQTIDIVSTDTVIEAGYSVEDTEKAKRTVDSFEKFVEENRDEIAALQILYSRPYGERHVTYLQIKELADVLREPPHNWTPEGLWESYLRLEKDRVHGAGERRVLTDVVSLVRHAVGQDKALEPYPDLVRARYEEWLKAREKKGRTFTTEQRWWLDRIAELIGVNLQIGVEDLDAPEFFDKGGRFAAAKLFGDQLPKLLDELNTALVA